MNYIKDKHYYKAVRVVNAWNNNYIKYESNRDRNKLLIEECLNKIRLCLKYIINNLKKSDL